MKVRSGPLRRAPSSHAEGSAAEGASGGVAAWCATASAPETRRGDARAFRHGFELLPHDRRVDGGLPYPRPVAAVATCDDVLPADQVGVATDPLRDQLGVLDEIGFRLDDARNQHLAVRELDPLEELPLVGMAGIGRLQ